MEQYLGICQTTWEPQVLKEEAYAKVIVTRLPPPKLTEFTYEYKENLAGSSQRPIWFSMVFFIVAQQRCPWEAHSFRRAGRASNWQLVFNYISSFVLI